MWWFAYIFNEKFELIVNLIVGYSTFESGEAKGQIVVDGKMNEDFKGDVEKACINWFNVKDDYIVKDIS